MPGLHDHHDQPRLLLQLNAIRREWEITSPAQVASAKRGGRISRHRGSRSSWRKPKGHPWGALDGREVRQDRLGQARRAGQVGRRARGLAT